MYKRQEQTAYLAAYRKSDVVVYVSRRGSVSAVDPRELGLEEDDVELLRKPTEHCAQWPLAGEVERHLDSVNLRDVFWSVVDVLRRHVGFRDDLYYLVTAAWVVAAHFFPVFSAFPVFFIGKPGFGHGGTTLLMLMLALCPRPILAVLPTSAAIMRAAEVCRATIGIDEVRRELTKTERDALIMLLDGGFQKGVRIPRARGGSSPDIVSYELYCPKIVVDPHGVIQSLSTISRGIRVVITRQPRFETAALADYVRAYADLAQSLYAAYLRYAHEVYEVYVNIRQSGRALGFSSGRALQTFAPLLAVAKLCGEDVYSAVHTACLQCEKQWSSGIDLAAVTLTVLADLLRSDPGHVLRTRMSTGEIYIDLSELARHVNAALQEMGIAKTRVTAAEVEHYVKSVLPPGSYRIEIIGWRKAAVLSRDMCTTTDSCREKLLDLIENLGTL